jgi:phage gp36-like protein
LKQQIIAAAEPFRRLFERMDGKLASKYTVPFSNTPTLAPPLIRDLATDLTYYRMTMRQDASKTLGEDLAQRFKDLLAGTLSVVTTSGDLVTSNSDMPWSTTQGYHSAFSSDIPENWVPSSQQVYDERTERGQWPA